MRKFLDRNIYGKNHAIDFAGTYKNYQISQGGEMESEDSPASLVIVKLEFNSKGVKIALRTDNRFLRAAAGTLW